MRYRAEIDGLRAIAVIPVILFHAGFELFSGGFVGVDIFFVISGYLITTILIDDLKKNSFSLINFYERRARRILPALYFMVILSIIFGWFVLTPYFYRDLFQTVTSISLFLSNFLLYIKSGYFAPIAELKPFMHTWSLAIEEQYYLFFPILLMIFWRFGWQKMIWMFIIIFIASFLFCLWALNHHPKANFLLLPSRVWELLAGSLLAFFIQRRGLRSNNFLAILGLLAILISVFTFDSSIPFPSYYTLIPVIGTMIIILFANNNTFVAKILSIKFIVSLGLISYSLYLWHQPIFSFLKHLLFNEPTNVQNFIAILLVFCVSFFSWSYVERPFRDRKKFSKKTIITLSILILSTTAILGLIGHKNFGFTNRLSVETQSISEGAFDKNPKQFTCNYLNNPNNIDSSCLLGNKKYTKTNIILIGDSHGDHLVENFDKVLKSMNLPAYNFTFKNCSPVNFKNGTSEFKDSKCFLKINKFLRNNKNINKVIMSFRWVNLLPGTPYGNNITHKNKVLDKKILINRAEIIAKKIEEIIGPGTELMLIYPVPEPGEDVPNYTVKRRILGENNFALTNSYKLFVERNKYAYLALDLISQAKRIVRVYPSSVLCDETSNGSCKTIFNGKSLYYDDDHLSNFGASLLNSQIIPFLDKN